MEALKTLLNWDLWASPLTNGPFQWNLYSQYIKIYKGYVTYKLWASLLLKKTCNLLCWGRQHQTTKCTHIHTKMGLLSSFRLPSWQDWTWTSSPLCDSEEEDAPEPALPPGGGLTNEDLYGKKPTRTPGWCFKNMEEGWETKKIGESTTWRGYKDHCIVEECYDLNL